MPSLAEVKEQIGRMDKGRMFLGRREIKELPNILWEDEVVEKIVQGVYSRDLGVLVATNKRLLFVDKKLFGVHVEDFPYDKVTSINYETGLLLGKITIYAAGNRSEIKQVAKDRVRDFCDYVRARITAKSTHASLETREESTDVIDKLEKLVALRDKGVITDAEFLKHKEKLLS